MADIKNFSGAVHGFRANTGSGSFSKKIKRATSTGNLINLKDNRQAILKTVKKYERAIRLGKFDRLRQLGAWKEIKATEGNKLTKDDTKEIKRILKHLGSRQESGVDAKKKINMDLALDKDLSYAEKKWEERKAKISAQIGRFDRRTSGGDSQLKFASKPQSTDRPEYLEAQQVSVSERLLKRRFLSREEKFKQRLPRYTAQYDKEREKRFEVSSLQKNQKDKGQEDKKLAGPPPSSFQNL